MIKRLLITSVFCMSLVFSSSQVRAGGRCDLDSYLKTLGVMFVIYHLGVNQQDDSSEEDDTVGQALNWAYRKGASLFGYGDDEE